MRPVINSTFVTLDGVVNHMEQWHFDYVDAESDAIALDQLMNAEALLMGRVTYEVYAGAWPGREGAYPDRINAMPKYVVSSTLSEPGWANTTVLTGDLLEDVAKLRDGHGGPILMHGYGPVAKALLGAGLLDEMHLWFHPSLRGIGDASDRLHTEGLSADFDLQRVTPLKSGVVLLSYHRREQTA
jgi:dihydrofolate reductase